MPATTPTSAPQDTVMIDAATTPRGTVLTDSSGFVLYLLTADSPARSNCTTFPCTTVWRPVWAAGGGTAGSGVQQSLLGTLRSPDGIEQVTYAGHPLYTYIGDLKAAQTSGEGIQSFGGVWWVLSAATGAAITGSLSMI
jgi:predicted lipoprotein with Yx(FWY)xxD motif